MSGPTVTVKTGALLGTTGTNLDGEEYYRFLGIPFAKPPVGPLRFKAPQPAECWQGIRDATKDSNQNKCLDFTDNVVKGSEDCLYLNVYTRTLPKDDAKLKPVMVYIHGGGFIFGAGTEKMVGAEYMMTQDIVFVAMNYRLGVFGFLSLDDTSLDVPGNAGLKDQTLALKWIQENISSFNGDPNNVTIFGISAGGAAVEFQLISPLAKGLFHKAIAQSGSVFDPWAWGQKNAIPLAEKLGHKVTNEKDALDVLMQVTEDQLYDASIEFVDFILNPATRRPFGPVIEKPNPTAFLTEDPYILLSEGRYNHVPYIQGTCADEGLGYEFSKPITKPFEPQKNIVPWNITQSQAALDALRNLYYKDGVTQQGIWDHLSDTNFVVGSLESTRLIAKTAKFPLYYYVFDYETQFGLKYKKFACIGDDVPGFAHGQDEPFLFPSQFDPKSSENLSQHEIEAIKSVIQIWTDFARTGSPHSKWQPIDDADNITYLLIDKELKLLKKPYENRMKVWRQVLKEAGPINAKLLEIPQ